MTIRKATPEERREILIAKADQRRQGPRRPGFFSTLISEGGAGLGEAVSGAMEFLGFGDPPILGGLGGGPGSPVAAAKTVMGGLRTFPGAPIEAIAQLGGNIVQDVGQFAESFLPGGSPQIKGIAPSDVAAGLVKGAIQTVSPSKAVGLVTRGVEKVRGLIPKIVSTRSELRKVSPRISPTKTDIETGGEILREHVTPQVKDISTPIAPPIMEEFVASVSSSISPTVLGKTRAGAELAERVIPQAGRAARRSPARKYNRARKLGGDETFPQPNTDAALNNIIEESKSVQGVLPTEAERIAMGLEKGGVPRGPGVAKAQKDIQALQKSGVSGLPEDILKEFGLGITHEQKPFW